MRLTPLYRLIWLYEVELSQEVCGVANAFFGAVRDFDAGKAEVDPERISGSEPVTLSPVALSRCLRLPESLSCGRT